MKKKPLLAAAFIVVGLIIAFASNASAFPGVSEALPCNGGSGCHSGSGVNPVATVVSNDGTNATYNVSSGGLEWALFAGENRLAGQPGATGQFTVPVGATYTLFAVQGFPGPLGITSVTPGAPVATFTITPTAGANGSIAPATPQVVESGSNLAFTITAGTGYHIVDVLVDGSSIGPVGSHTFTNVTGNHTISASFAINVAGTFTITPSAGANGSISPSTVQTVTAGGTVPFTFTPDPGYHLETVLVDGTPVAAVSPYIFTNVQADHTITATFSNDTESRISTVLAAHVSASRVRRGKYVNLTSVLRTAAGAPVTGVFVRYVVLPPGSHTWRLFSLRMVDANGASRSSRIKLRAHGTYRFRARFAGTDDFRPTTSSTLKVIVR